MTFVVGDDSILPFSLPFALADGSLGAERWLALRDAAAIRGADLGGAVPGRRFR